MYKKVSQGAKLTVCVACADDANLLEAVEAAKDMANFILVGNTEKIRRAADEAQADISRAQVVNEMDPVSACNTAVQFVSFGMAQALMKGQVDTSIIMKAVLNKESGMRTGKKLSHLAVFELPTYHKLLFVADAAINIAPDLDVMIDIINNSVEAVLALGITMPKVALLAAKEKSDPKMPATELAENIAARNILFNRFRLEQGTGSIYSQLEVDPDEAEFVGKYHLDGPLALDNAICKESVKIKGIDSVVGGDADILVCPDIEAGNILYKALAFLANAKHGGVVLGAKRPIILTSRADSAQSKLNSIALGILS
ncbi:MAG: phosphate acyltransferase [Defluviitaleaceae bacterium]|nr:phosphate acyltransferase [Defluviitaleaceae bacterium]